MTRSSAGVALAASLVVGLLMVPRVAAQAPPGAPVAVLSMDDAVRLALDRNQTLRAERLTIDQSKADEITAALKPNINASFNAEQLSVFSPSQFSFSTGSTNATYIGASRLHVRARRQARQAHDGRARHDRRHGQRRAR